MCNEILEEEFEEVEELLDDCGDEEDFNENRLKEDIVNVNAAINNIDSLLKQVLLSDEIKAQIHNLYSKNYNKLKMDERIALINSFHYCIIHKLSTELMEDAIYTTTEDLQNYNGMEVRNGCMVFGREHFKRKDLGLILFRSYIEELRKGIVTILVGSALQLGVKNTDLENEAKEYYENLSGSIFNNSWDNYIPMREKNYSKQPIVFDSESFSYDIIFEYIKDIYKNEKVIDREMSQLLYGYMDFESKFLERLEKRKEIAKENLSRLEEHKDETEHYNEYMEITRSNLSSLSDEEFYALFNEYYFMNLDSECDKYFTTRIQNISQQLLYRTFKEYDLDNVDIPTYEVQLSEDKKQVILFKAYKNKTIEFQFDNIAYIIGEVIGDINEIANRNLFFNFNSEKEKQDCIDMRKWMDSKKGKYNNEDAKILNNQLNILSVKVNDLIRNMITKIEQSIKKSKYVPKGKSIIRIRSRDALFDYHEFKNGHTKEEVTEKLMKQIRDDLNKGGR